MLLKTNMRKTIEYLEMNSANSCKLYKKGGERPCGSTTQPALKRMERM